MKDAIGRDLIYWPISGLIEGQDSEVLEFTEGISGNGKQLYASSHSDIKVWAKKVGDLSFVDISDVPYSLAGLSGDTDFQIYIEALTPLDLQGLERIPVSVVSGSASPAGWMT